MIKVIGEIQDVESLEVVDDLRMKELKLWRTCGVSKYVN